MPRQPRHANCDLHQHTAFHIVSRCARQLHLFGGSDRRRQRRKALFLAELERLATFTAVDVAGFAVMDNHIHLLLKVDVDGAHRWTPRQVAERWLALHPPRNGRYRRLDVEEEHITALCADTEKLESCREKLTSVSQFMKELKQEVAQKINALDQVTGPLWAGRFKCKAIENEAQLLATLAYIDLNPFAANTCEVPEAGQHTTLAARLHGPDARNTDKNARATNKATPHKAPNRKRLLNETQGWWLPLEPASASRADQRRCLIPKSDLCLKTYLSLLDATSRLIRPGKRRQSRDAERISHRINKSVTVSPRQLVDHYLNDWYTQGLKWAGIPPVS